MRTRINLTSAEFATDSASPTMVVALGILCPNIAGISISALGETVSDELAACLRELHPALKEFRLDLMQEMCFPIHLVCRTCSQHS